MTQTVLRWVLGLLAVFAVGPLAGRLAASTPGLDGGPHTSMLLSSSATGSIVGVLAAFALAALVAGVSAVLVGRGPALTFAGFVLAWAAGSAGTIDGLLTASRPSSVFPTLALEGLIIAGLTFAIVLLVLALERAAPPAENDPADRPSKSRRRDSSLESFSGPALSLVAAIGAGALTAIIVARSTLSGQAIAAAAAAAAIGCTASAAVFKAHKLSLVAAALTLLAVAGPASGFLVHGASTARASNTGTLTPLARITPLHWSAGLLIGLPLGLSWAAALHKKP